MPSAKTFMWAFVAGLAAVAVAEVLDANGIPGPKSAGALKLGS